MTKEDWKRTTIGCLIGAVYGMFMDLIGMNIWTNGVWHAIWSLALLTVIILVFTAISIARDAIKVDSGDKK